MAYKHMLMASGPEIAVTCRLYHLKNLLKKTSTQVKMFWSIGPTVYHGKFCQILRASSRNSAVHGGKIVQIPRRATASYLWLKTVQKLQLLKAGIILKA